MAKISVKADSRERMVFVFWSKDKNFTMGMTMAEEVEPTPKAINKEKGKPTMGVVIRTTMAEIEAKVKIERRRLGIQDSFKSLVERCKPAS